MEAGGVAVENPARKKGDNDLEEERSGSDVLISCRRQVEAMVGAILRCLGWIPARGPPKSSSPEPDRNTTTVRENLLFPVTISSTSSTS